MTYETYRLAFFISVGISALMLILSIVFFFVFKIVGVIGDLTGTTAKKAIQDIREQNINSGDKAYKVSPINIERGKLTDKMTLSGKLINNRQNENIRVNVGTEKIMQSSNETEVLVSSNMSSNETVILISNEPKNDFDFEVENDITYTHTQESIV